MGAFVSLDSLLRLRPEQRQSGRILVLTNGYFDLLHVGHTRYLAQAKALGDILVVAVNADATARRSKDPRRPILPETDRAELIAALACVDYALLFEEDTAERVVSLLQPEIYAKGGDYGPGRAALPEAAIVESYGGQVVLLPFQPGHSTTSIVQTILNRYGPDTETAGASDRS